MEATTAAPPESGTTSQPPPGGVVTSAWALEPVVLDLKVLAGLLRPFYGTPDTEWDGSLLEVPEGEDKPFLTGAGHDIIKSAAKRCLEAYRHLLEFQKKEAWIPPELEWSGTQAESRLLALCMALGSAVEAWEDHVPEEAVSIGDLYPMVRAEHDRVRQLFETLLAVERGVES